MTVHGWLTIAVVLAVFVGLVKNLAAPDVLFLGAVAFLALCGVIATDQAFAGFSNPGVLTVGLLFIVVAALRETGVLDHLGHHILGKCSDTKQALRRIAAVVMPLSAFLNNTPIVAMFVPLLVGWSRRHQVSPSKLLLPLSYFTILGGTCTLIGTSTNLVVSGLMHQNQMKPLGMFELSWVGIPYAVIGAGYIFFIGLKMLPERKELLEQLGESRKEYLIEMLVQPRCRLIGQTVEQAGLRHLPGLFLIEIDRGGTITAPVSPDDVIQEGDRLVFTGVVSSFLEMEKIPGLVPAADPAYEISPRSQRRRRLCEAVISESSPLIGKTIREADFRATYGAAVVAVHRGGSRLSQKVGEISLRPGDTLLLQTRPHFLRAHRNDPSFYLISDVEQWRPSRRDRAWVATGLFLLLVVMMSSSTVPILAAAAIVAFLAITTGCISAGEARQSIEWQVLITIACAFGIGTALQTSGAAATIAAAVFQIAADWGPVAALAGIYILCSFMTEVITNNAAAVLIFPFCVEIAKLYQVSPRPFLIALVLAASASFMTPIGYQTNMMVYGPGGYRFADFIRIGAPLNTILAIVAVVLIPVFWSF